MPVLKDTELLEGVWSKEGTGIGNDSCHSVNIDRQLIQIAMRLSHHLCKELRLAQMFQLKLKRNACSSKWCFRRELAFTVCEFPNVAAAVGVSVGDVTTDSEDSEDDTKDKATEDLPDA